MKQFRKILGLLLVLPMLVGCGDQGKHKDTSGDEYEITDYGTVEFKSKDYIQKGGNYGETFADVAVGRYVANDSTYLFSYTSSNVNPAFEIFISNPNLATATMEEGSTTNFTITTANAIGDFILKIEDADGMLVYRNVIHVRRKYTAEYMPQRLYNIDFFASPEDYAAYIGSWRLTVTEFSTTDFTATLTGGDDYEQNVSISFTATYDTYVPYFDGYSFTIKTTKSTAKLTVLTGLVVARCSDYMYIYVEDGLLTMLTAR